MDNDRALAQWERIIESRSPHLRSTEPCPKCGEDAEDGNLCNDCGEIQRDEAADAQYHYNREREHGID